MLASLAKASGFALALGGRGFRAGKGVGIEGHTLRLMTSVSLYQEGHTPAWSPRFRKIKPQSILIAFSRPRPRNTFPAAAPGTTTSTVEVD